MKLIYCPKCHDVVRGMMEPRKCACGSSGLQYTDSLNAVYWGEAVPLGFANSSFVDALGRQPEEGGGKLFTAFVIPKNCPTFKLDKSIS
jgi:hypothetical protein